MSNENQIPTADKVPLTKKIYKLRCLDGSSGVTKNGHKQYKLQLEIAPIKAGVPTMIQGVCVDGVKLYGQSVVTAASLKYANVCRSAFGLPALTPDDIEATDGSEFKDQECFAICSGSMEEQKDGDDAQMFDPYTGEPLMKNKREVLEWIPRPA